MTTAVERARRADRFPGTRVVSGCFVILAVSSGLGFYGLAVYLNAFSNEKGWPLAKAETCVTVTRPISARASCVRNAWCAVMSTFEKSEQSRELVVLQNLPRQVLEKTLFSSPWTSSATPTKSFLLSSTIGVFRRGFKWPTLAS